MNGVSGIIVSFNPDVKVINDLISDLSPQVQNIFLIDNNSQDKSFLGMLKENNKVNIVRLDDNFGLGYAQNIGIKSALSTETDHLIFFDQDSIISHDFVLRLLSDEARLINEKIDLAVIGPKLIDKESNYEYPATKYSGFLKKRPMVGSSPVETTFTIASGSLIRREIIENVGGMNEWFFIDYIDVEWCMRARSFGYKTYMSSACFMLHDMGDKKVTILKKKISLHSDFRYYYIFRNAIYLMRLKYIPFGYKRILFSYSIIRFLLALFFSTAKIKFLSVGLKALISGLFDSLKGRVHGK